MNSKEIISKVKNFLNQDKEKYLYRNLGSIAEHIGVDKTNILRALTTCEDIEIIFNEEVYNPNSGPLFALKDNIRAKAKESRILVEQEKEKQKEKKTSKENSSTYKKPQRTSKHVNRRRIKNCTKKFIAVHKTLDDVLKAYSISLSKNDPEFIERASNIMSDFTSLIKDIIEKNDYSQYELEDKK